MINQVLHELLNKGVIIYIDNILIYSEMEEEHIRLVSKVLEKLKRANCKDVRNTSEYFGLISCNYDGSNRSCHKLICISFL